MSLSRGLSKVKNFLNLIEVPAILLLVWGAVSHFGLFPEFLLPSPEKVWSSFVELLVCGELWKHIAASAGRVFGGFFLAMLVAIPLAYFFYYNRIDAGIFHSSLPKISDISIPYAAEIKKQRVCPAAVKQFYAAFLPGLITATSA